MFVGRFYGPLRIFMLRARPQPHGFSMELTMQWHKLENLVLLRL